MKKPIDHHKSICRALAPDGWTYTGWDDGFYLFQKRTLTGWLEMRCLYEDLTRENLKLMADMGLTRL